MNQLRKKVISLIVLIFLLFFYVQVGVSSGIPVYVGVNQTTPSVSQLISLKTSNYSIYVNIEGDMSYSFPSSIFTITKGSVTYFTVTVSASAYMISRVIERRLIITETGDYNFSFILDTNAVGNYLNYEVILTEMAIIYKTKTSIVAEAPYGMSFILLAIICNAIIQKRRKNNKKEN